MEYKSKAYVYLSISGTEFDTTDFIDAFKISPTEVGENKHGEKFFKYKINAKNPFEGLEEALENLRQVFIYSAGEIKSYAFQKELYVKIFVVILGENNEDNGAFLDIKFIEFLNRIGAEIEIDMYN